MQDEHRPSAFADDEVALPMAGLAAAFNGLRTIMDRSSILDGVARGSGATGTTAFVAPRQIAPQGLGLLCGPIDKGVDCLAANGWPRRRGSFPDFNHPEISSGVRPL